MKKTSESDRQLFEQKLRKYKQIIDADITSYGAEFYESYKKQYGENASVPVDVFLNVLRRGGKRLRGALVMYGYEVSGGIGASMILTAARAVEMIHAYLLIMDDIQDRSVLRRGEPTAHVALAKFHKQKNYSGDADHFGVAIALNAMGIGNHLAHKLLAELDTAAERKLSVITLLEEAIVLTAHGQTLDIENEMSGEASVADVGMVMEYKTAHYTILNPLQIGMTLAGANKKQIQALSGYALHVGRAFQIKDDITGVFGTAEELGKSPLDDIREGKQTLLTVHALESASAEDKPFLLRQLGNKKLTASHFETCKDIITRSGALAFAKKLLHTELASARTSLKNYEDTYKTGDLSFLRGLIDLLDTVSN